MSVQEIEERVRELPPEELRRFAEWWERYRESALLPPPPGGSSVPPIESEAVKQELLARQREYHEHPERFVPMDEQDLDRMFHEINEEVRKKTSPRPR